MIFHLFHIFPYVLHALVFVQRFNVISLYKLSIIFKVIEATGAKVTVENDLDQAKDEFIQLLEDFRSRVDAGGEAEPELQEDKGEQKDGYYNYYQN